MELSTEKEPQPLKASFRNNVNNHLHVYRKNEVILLISPMQPYYNDKEKFKAIINIINQSRFKKCHIVVGDTNYQHTLKINMMDNSEAYTLASEMGLRWINENDHIFSTLSIPYGLSRWDEWVQHVRYQYHRDKLDLLVKTDSTFQECFINTAIEFIERNRNIFQINPNNFNHAIECCLEYLKEECAIIMPLWAELRYPFIIYPTKMLDAMKACYDKLVCPYYSVKPHWLSLRFASKKSSVIENTTI